MNTLHTTDYDNFNEGFLLSILLTIAAEIAHHN